MNRFEARVARTLREYNMLKPGESVLTGVSGGADSVALLHCLVRLAPRWQLQITAAHLNHGTRGAESDQDEQFVKILGKRLGVPVIAESLDVPALAWATGRNLEELAREERYRFFRRAANQAGAGKIAVGHTRDDQAETVLMRMLRGSGMRGLAGIHPVLDGKIVRPLIDVSRSQVLRYIDAAGLTFREDSSNRSLTYLRNRVRRELLPYLRARFNPRIDHVLARQARLARNSSEYLEAVAAEAVRELHLPADFGFVLRRSALLALHPALQTEVLRYAVRDCCGSLRGITADHIGDILRVARGTSGRSTAVGRGIVATREFDSVVLSCGHPKTGSSYEYRLSWPGVCPVPEAGLLFTATLPDDGTECAPSRQHRAAVLAADLLPRELIVRSRRPGDCYGGPGHRKVKKMLIDARVPRSSRCAVPMVVAGSAVVWIPGFPPAKSFRAEPGSGRCVVVACEPLGPAR